MSHLPAAIHHAAGIILAFRGILTLGGLANQDDDAVDALADAFAPAGAP